MGGEEGRVRGRVRGCKGERESIGKKGEEKRERGTERSVNKEGEGKGGRKSE